MAGTTYLIDPIRSVALKGDYYNQLQGNQAQLNNIHVRLTSIQSAITALQEKLHAVQVQVLQSLTPSVQGLTPSTPISMTVNNDGTVTLVVDG